MTVQSVVQVVLNLAEGGMETMAVNLAVALAARGHRVTVIALDSGGRHERALEAAGVEWHVLGGRRLSGLKQHGRLRRLIRQADADVVHTHHFAPLVHTMAAATAAGWIPIVHTEHSYQYLERRPDYRLALWTLAFRCRSVVLVGQAMLPYYRSHVRISRRRLRVIRNGVPLPPPGPTALSQGSGAPGLPVGTVVMSAGRFFPVKRYQDLITAVALARGTVPDLHLVLLGSGPEESRLRSLASELKVSDAVHFPGWQENLAAWLAAADIFALTSQSEGLPMAALEAMAFGVPVLGTAVGDLPELLADGAGIVVPVGRPDEIAQHLVTLAGNPMLRSSMGSLGRARVERNYSLEAMVQSYASLYAS